MTFAAIYLLQGAVWFYAAKGKIFDDGVVSRLSEDFLIPNFHLVDIASRGEHTLDIVDPVGKVVGALAWSPPSLGNQAHDQVSPTVFMMLALVGCPLLRRR